MWDRLFAALPPEDAELLRDLAIEQIAGLIVGDMLEGAGDEDAGGVLLQGVDEEE